MTASYGKGNVQRSTGLNNSCVTKMKLPVPKEGSAQYQGAFTMPAFRIFAGPDFNVALFNALSKYGVRVENVKIDNGNVPSITYDLTALSCSVRVALDKVELNFYSLQLIGVERARELALSCWSAIHAVDEEITFEKHTLTLSYQFEVGEEEYRKILGNYVNTPAGLPAATEPGVVFYVPPSRKPEQGTSIVLDRLGPGILNLRIVMFTNATEVAPAALPQYIDSHVVELLSTLGLEVET